MAANSPVRTGDDFFRGEDKVLPFAVVDGNGAAQNITGWTIVFRLYDSQAGTLRLTKSAGITSGPLGTCTVSFAAADTVGLTGATYWYELVRTDASNSTILAYGDFELRAR